MKKTQFKEIFRNIRRNLVNFISIVVFVFLGVGLFEGLGTCEHALKQNMDNAFRERNAYDLIVGFQEGISQESINKFKEMDGVDEVEGVYTVYDYFSRNNNRISSMVHSLTSNLNQTTLVAGRMPQAPWEIVVEAGCIKYEDYKFGDIITFEGTYGSANYVINKLRDPFSITLDGLLNDNKSSFVNNSFVLVGSVCNPLYLNNSKQSFGISLYDKSQVSMVFYCMDEAFNPITRGGLYNNVLIKNNYLDSIPSYSDEYFKRIKEFANEVKIYANNLRYGFLNKIIDGINEAIENEGLLRIITQLLKREGLIDVDLEETGEILKSKIDEFKEQFLSHYEVTIVTRRDNPIFVFLNIMADIFSKVKYSLGALFIVISLFICYSVITRLVHDDHILMGTKKALGFTNFEITKGYLLFSFFAVAIGLIGGTAISFLIQKLVLIATRLPYDFDVTVPTYNLPLMIIPALAILLLIEAVTLLGCLSDLRKKPIALLTGNDEKKNRASVFSKFKIWKKIPLLNRTIINNIKNDSKRVSATIIGIAASCCMIVGSLASNRNVSTAIYKEFDDYFKFSSFIYCSSFEENNDVKAYCDENNLNTAPILRDVFTFNIDEQIFVSGYLIVYDDAESFNKLVYTESVDDTVFENKGLWIPESYKVNLKLDKNTRVEMSSPFGISGNTTIYGYFRYYSYMPIFFMDAQSYEEVFLQKFKPNCYMVDCDPYAIDTISKDLVNASNFQSTATYYIDCSRDIDVFNLISVAIFALYSSIAFIMSIFVTLNLLTTFVSEKKKELITLRINGFSLRQTKKYIYVDTIFLTIFGIIFGILTGSILGDLIVSSYESVHLVLIKGFDWLAALVGFGFTSLLVFIITLISLKPIKKLKLTDINSTSF